MKRIRPCELTPDARIDAAKRSLASAIDELIEARIAKGVTASEWVDQDSSPLGRDRHLRLIRRGVLKAVRDGHRRLVRRSDLDAYLNDHPVEARKSAASDDEDLEEMIRKIAGGSR